jgi:hypothetical protein
LKDDTQPAERALAFAVDVVLSPAPRALISGIHGPGVSLRSNPGFMLSPAPQAGEGFRDFVEAQLKFELLTAWLFYQLMDSITH